MNEPHLASVVRQLDLALYQRTADGAFELASPAPGWLASCFDESDLVDQCDFLEYFLSEAEDHWGGEMADEVLSSGPWEQQCRDGEAHGSEFVEALAMRSGDTELIVLRKLGADFATLSRHVQRSNELAIERGHLNRETQRRVLLLDCVVHDLCNPLATVMASLHFLTTRLPEGEEKDVATTALGQAERQHQLIRSMVGLFSADTEHFGDPSVLRCDARAAADSIVRAQSDAAADKGVSLVLEDRVGRKPAMVAAEESHLQRALENLVVNAIRHSPVRGTVSVTIGEEGNGDEICLAVVDEGPGVDPDRVATMFDPFSRSEGGGQAGLGLFFCKRAVRRWGGEIGHENREPTGARFWMRLKKACEDDTGGAAGPE